MNYRSLFRALSMAAVLGSVSPGVVAVATPELSFEAPHRGHYFSADAIDLAVVLPAPPAPASLAGLADLEAVLQAQAARTPEQVAWAKFTEHDDLFKNALVLGEWFTAENLPFTAEFFGKVDDDGYIVSLRSKARYPRLRPPLADARVQPCVEVPKSAAYPSGHSSQAWMWAGLLAEIFPERRAEIFERARAVAWSRVIAGVHYPTDAIGGKLLADAIMVELLKNPAVRAAIERCRAEAEPFLRKKAA